MASQAGGIIQDQNLNICYNDASAGWKTNVSKAPRKGGLGGRTPLGDLSNSLKPSVNQMSKKKNSSIFSFTDKETSGSQVVLDASKKKSSSKSSAKVQTSGRKALTDISNSGKPHVNEVSKKNYNAKLSAVAEQPIPPSVIAEEQFLHNHQECIKAQTRAMDMDQFLQIVGLDNDFSKPLATPWALPLPTKLKAQHPPSYLELEEMTEQLTEDRSWKCTVSSKLDSSPACRTPPMSPKHSLHWNDHDYVNFKLIETPQLPKH